MSASLRNIAGIGADCYSSSRCSSIHLRAICGQRNFGKMVLVPPSIEVRPLLSVVQEQTVAGIVTRRNMANNYYHQTDKTLTVDNVYSNLRRMEYAVRGPLLIRAIEIEKELEKVNIKLHIFIFFFFYQ